MKNEEIRRLAYALVEAELRGCDFRAILLNPHSSYFVQTASETGDFKSLREAVDTFLADSVQPDERDKLAATTRQLATRLGGTHG